MGRPLDILNLIDSRTSPSLANSQVLEFTWEYVS